MSSAKRLEMRIGGLLGFHDNSRTLFCWTPKFKKSGNLIGTVLMNAILATKTSDTPAAGARKLYLQVDGGSENINR